ncbi:hypothetical protein B2J93_3978 [Marssonina coronariae]|uniref:Uncharacterized protein n=1 Tax=Diplocarpon coronariae TaxID=2795749 RepID=A0A218YXG8_9HELO|nr:hypothetical protein B2J93_3978 [Marssonina coronariae]
MHFKSLAAAAAAGTVAAQNPPSFCDKYTAALFKDNSAANQLKLLTAVVNTAVIGNYTESKTGTAVPGILAPAVVDGKAVNLLPYFNGCLASTNAGGTPKAVNFLDDGGAAPLMMDKPSNSSGSRQYDLLTHLYEYFGILLGCSHQGDQGSTFGHYSGHPSMYEVHKYMNLDHAEVTYFIEQVASAALSFGVDPADLGPVGLALDQLFNYKCLPATEPVPGQGKQLQSICSAQSCPILPSSNCGAYSNITDPLSVCPDDAISSNKTTIIIVTGKKCPTTCTSATCQCMHGPVVVDGDEYDNDEEDESGSGSNEEDADEESVDGSSGEGSDNPSSGSILGPGASNSTGNNGAVPGSGSANTSGSGAGASNYTGNAGANPGSGSGSTSGSGAGAGAGANSGSGSSSGSDSGSGSSSDSIAGSGSGSSGPEVVSTAMASAFGMSLAAILAGSLAVFFYL